MKTGRLLFAALFALAPSLLFAQVAADPLDFFYDDLVIWETSGLVNNLPAARPYPLQLVREILETVIERGDSTASRIAQTHFRRFFGKTLAVGTRTEAMIDSEADKQLAVAIALDFNTSLTDSITASASVDGWATNKLFNDELLVQGQASSKDIIDDNASIGPFKILPSVSSSIAVGNAECYLNAGLMRGSWGPFHSNGVVVGPQSIHSGQYDFAVNKPLWGFNLSLYSLSATTASDDESFYPEKFLSVHSFEYRPFDWLAISFLESVMYGNRMDLTYLLPMSPFMISQGVTGLSDNSWLGGMFTVKPVEGLKIDGVLYADDLSFNDIVKLNFDTKWRLAGQIGTSYAPRSSGVFTLASVDYTMITPYAYSHRNKDDTEGLDTVNYQNYLHAGNPFGANLDPNTDRVNLKIKLRPLEDVDFDVVGTLIRHGNVNEGIDRKWVREYLVKENKYRTDGSVLNPSASDVGHAFFYSTPFLTQDTIQYIWQTGFDALCRLPVLKSGGQIIFRFGYRFECDINGGINEELYRYAGTTYTYTDDDGATKVKDGDELTDAEAAEVDKQAADQYASWLADATGTEINHYISVGFEYFY